MPPGMDMACPRHARAVLHGQAPVCAACPRMERRSGIGKFYMAVQTMGMQEEGQMALGGQRVRTLW